MSPGFGPEPCQDSVELDLEHSSPAQVRAELRRLLVRREDVDAADVLQVSDELISNAYRHALPPRRCRMSMHTSGRFHIEVDDGSPTPPHARRPDACGGRGLLLINHLSTRWGVGYRDDGKTVWAELAPTSAYDKYSKVSV